MIDVHPRTDSSKLLSSRGSSLLLFWCVVCSVKQLGVSNSVMPRHRATLKGPFSAVSKKNPSRFSVPLTSRRDLFLRAFQTWNTSKPTKWRSQKEAAAYLRTQLLAQPATQDRPINFSPSNSYFTSLESFTVIDKVQQTCSAEVDEFRRQAVWNLREF